ncbi:hypothetical protein Ddc_01007 [Ditylenchus destructor]|nr:hypothetical protein Ddc_01007 [Ditylenchus destructor]
MMTNLPTAALLCSMAALIISAIVLFRSKGPLLFRDNKEDKAIVSSRRILPHFALIRHAPSLRTSKTSTTFHCADHIFLQQKPTRNSPLLLKLTVTGNTVFQNIHSV